MINTSDFAERLRIVMEHYALNASSFADRIGVQRSGISHILAGRNKPSLDFILKVINAFETVDIYWLLIGKGSFPASGTGPPEEKKESKPAPETMAKPRKYPVPEEIYISKAGEKKGRKITRIIILYENGNFDSFEN